MNIWFSLLPLFKKLPKKNPKKIPMKHNKHFAKDFKLEKLKNS